MRNCKISFIAGWDQNLLWSGHSLHATPIMPCVTRAEKFPDSSIQILSGHQVKYSSTERIQAVERR